MSTTYDAIMGATMIIIISLGTLLGMRVEDE